MEGWDYFAYRPLFADNSLQSDPVPFLEVKIILNDPY